MYIARPASRNRNGKVAREDLNACAVPADWPWMLAGMPICEAARSIAIVAGPSATPGDRLKEIVVAGNWPWWLTDSGTVVWDSLTNVDSGTWSPLDDET